MWRIILRYQIFDQTSHDNMKPGIEVDYKQAAHALLRWVNGKGIPADDFTSRWTDGVALCLLVNAVQANTIPESMFKVGVAVFSINRLRLVVWSGCLLYLLIKLRIQQFNTNSKA